MFKSSEGRWRKRMHQPGGAGRSTNDRGQPVTAMSSSLSSATSGAGSTHRALQLTRHSSASNPHASAPENDPQLPPREIAGWIVEPIAFPQVGASRESVGTGGDAAEFASRHTRTASESRHHLLQDRQQQQQQQQRQEAQSASTVATLIVVSVFTYALYHASIEALAEERTRIFFGGASVGDGAGVEESFHYGRAIASAATASFGGSVGGSFGDEEVDRHQNGGRFSDAEASPVGMVWGRGVSLVTVSAWQSLSALGAGFIASRFWRRGRKPEPSALGDADRNRRNRCLMVFAVAHLVGTGLEYHGYGMIGPIASEVLRSTETALFCLLSVIFGIQRPGLGSVPTLLLALGLTLAATPASGEFRVGWEGLRASLAANFLLAVRAIAAKTVLDDHGVDEIWALFSATKMTVVIQFIILLAIEVPRAASGQAPLLLPHLWGVGVAGGTDHDGVIGSGWEGSGRERARLACLLLANGLCLCGHVLALLGLLSRLSATMFAVSSGYVHVSVVFVLLLSLRGSATVPRSAGMALATIAVAVHLYRTYGYAYARGRITLPVTSDEEDSNTGDIIGEGSGSDRPLPQLPLLLREGSATGDEGDTSSTSPGGRGNGGGGDRELQSTPLFVPLLGTRHHEGDVETGVALQGSPSGTEESGVGDGGGGRPVSPSQFAWRWMGLRPTETPPFRPSEKHQQDNRHGRRGGDGGSASSRAGAMPRFSTDSRLPPRPTTFGTCASAAAAALGGLDARPSSDESKGGGGSIPLSSSLRYGEGASGAVSASTYNSAYSGRSPLASLGVRHYLAPDYDGIEVPAIQSSAAPATAAAEVAASGSVQHRAWAPSSAPDGERLSGRSATCEGVSSRGFAAPGSHGSRGVGDWRRDEAGSSVEGGGFGRHVGGVSTAAGTGFEAGRRGGGGAVVPPSPASSSSFSLNGFEVIDKEDMWN